MMLVDTNVLSELSRARPDPSVLVWAGTVDHVHLSVVTVEEVQFGLACRPNTRVSGWFDVFLAESATVLPITDEIARRAGALRGQLRARGQERTQADMLIAATAAVHRLTIVTRNTKDFAGCGLPVLNPFGEAC